MCAPDCSNEVGAFHVPRPCSVELGPCGGATVTQRDSDYDLSIVIPAFNEAGRIGPPLRQIGRYLHSLDVSSEIIVVDDGSRDGTGDVVRAIGTDLEVPLKVISSSPNRGKGHAVRVGMQEATGRAVLMTDADLSTPIEELHRLLQCLADGFDVVIGSRKMAGAVIEERQPWLRESMGRVFTLLINVLLVRVSDVTCGFKLFSRNAALEIFSRMRIDDWSFDAEALYIAKRLGLQVQEVPVRWHDVAGTKVNRGLDALRSLKGIVRILWNGALGRYDSMPVEGGAGTRSPR